MRQRLLAFTAIVLLASTLNAQQPRGGPPGGGRGGMRVPDPVLFNGPPVPEDFLDLVTLDSTQYTAYRMRYVNFMEQTRPQRDSLLDFRRQMRDAMQSGGMSGEVPPGGRQGNRGAEARDRMQKTMSALEKRQKVFDEELKVLLKEPQYKRYEAWRKEELTRAEREMRERFGGGPPQ